MSAVGLSLYPLPSVIRKWPYAGTVPLSVETRFASFPALFFRVSLQPVMVMLFAVGLKSSTNSSAAGLAPSPAICISEITM